MGNRRWYHTLLPVALLLATGLAAALRRARS